MRPIRCPCLLAWLVLLAFAPAGSAQSLERTRPEDVGLSSERLERLSVALQKYVDEGRLPGVVALVSRHGKVAYLEAFGQRDIEAGDPLDENDIFRIASQTKALVSTAVMILQEQGDLLISDPVGRYLPEFMETRVAVAGDDGGYQVVPANRPVRIRDLLTHTAGVSYGSGPARSEWEEAEITGWYFAHREEPIRETVRRIAALPFDAQPGERFVYGYSTDILGALVEVVSGQPLDEFLRTRLFEPLGMTDTHFYLPTDKTDRFAAVYSLIEGELRRAEDQGGMVSQGAYVVGPRASFSGGAGGLSTAMDYARFLQMILNGGELDGVRILSPKTVELMTVNHVGDLLGVATGFGLGFSVLLDLGASGQPGSVGEYGWGGAYHSTYWVDPQEDMVVVYLTQVIPAAGLDDQAKLRALVYQSLIESGGH